MYTGKGETAFLILQADELYDISPFRRLLNLITHLTLVMQFTQAGSARRINAMLCRTQLRCAIALYLTQYFLTFIHSFTERILCRRFPPKRNICNVLQYVIMFIEKKRF